MRDSPLCVHKCSDNRNSPIILYTAKSQNMFSAALFNLLLSLIIETICYHTNKQYYILLAWKRFFLPLLTVSGS